MESPKRQILIWASKKLFPIYNKRDLEFQALQ